MKTLADWNKVNVWDILLKNWKIIIFHSNFLILVFIFGLLKLGIIIFTNPLATIFIVLLAMSAEIINALILVQNYIFRLQNNYNTKNDKERREYNLLIFAIIIMPTIQSIAEILLKLFTNWHTIQIADTFVLLLTVILSLIVATALKETNII